MEVRWEGGDGRTVIGEGEMERCCLRICCCKIAVGLQVYQ